MSTIDEIKRALELCKLRPDRMNFSALELMIAAALADARREGAERMRAEAAKLARALPLYYGSGDDGADECLAQAIDDLPLPTGPRQAVLLTRQQIDDVMTQHYPLESLLRENVDAFEAAVRDVESAVLAANNLEVSRG